MTELELRTRLNNLTGEIPAKTHCAFLSAASPGKEESIMKKKISAALIVAILVSLATLAFAANGLIRTLSVDWEGEVPANPENETYPNPVDELATVKKMHSLLSEIPADMYAIVEWNGTPPKLSRGRNRITASVEGIDHPGILIPKEITELDSFTVSLSYDCAAGGKYKLEKEENIDGFTVKQYSVDPSDDILTGYNIGYMEENHMWRSIGSRLVVSQASQFSFVQMDNNKSSVEPVEIPGMDKAVFVTQGLNHTLIATRTLKTPVIIKTAPGQYLPEARNDTTEYPYELIELEGFTLEECMSFFRTEESN